MKQIRRFLALLLAFSMTFSMVTPAFASETETAAEEPVEVVEEVLDEIIEEEADTEEEDLAPVVEEEIAASEEAVMAEEDASEDTATTVQLYPSMFTANAELKAYIYEQEIPAGATYNFELYNCTGKMLSVDGAEPVMVTPENPMLPYTFSITNSDAENAKVYQLVLTEPVGSYDNPETIELGWVDVEIAAGDTDGYFYSYTAEGTGNVELYLSSVPEGVEADILVTTTANYTQYTLSGNGVADEWGDLILTIPVTVGDVLTINVGVAPDAQGNYPEAAFTMIGNFTYPLGSEENPIILDVEWNEDRTQGTATVTAPVGTTYYGIYGVNGMMLSINGEWPIELNAMGMMYPAVFPIVNEGEAEAEYSLVLTLAPGHEMNPEILYGCGMYTAELKAGSDYYYEFEAGNDGTLMFELVGHMGNVEPFMTITNQNSKQWTLDDADENGVINVEVAAGDVLKIVLSAGYEAASIDWKFNYPLGTELNPVDLTEEWAWSDENRTDGTATVTVPAGETWYFQSSRVNGYTLVNGEEEQVLSGFGMMPIVFTITNTSEKEQSYDLRVYLPVGSYMNPEVLEFMSYHEFSLAEGDNDGYYYSFIVPETGTYKMYFNGVENYAADITVWNLTDWSAPTMVLTADGVDNYGLEMDVPVTAGDELKIQIVAVPTMDEKNNQVFAAVEGSWSANFTYPLGHENNPITPEWVWTEDEISATATVTVPAGETYYYSGKNGMYLVVNEEEPVLMTAASFWDPVTFVLEGGDEDTTYELTIYWPMGSAANPEELNVYGENSHEFEAGSNPYVYSIVAPDRGFMTFDLSANEGGWYFSATASDPGYNYSRNITGYSDYDTDFNDGVLAVNKGDIVKVEINTYDPENWMGTPSGTVSFTAEFEPALGSETNPFAGYYDGETVTYWTEMPTGTIAAGVADYYSIQGVGEMIVTVATDADLSLLITETNMMGMVMGQTVVNKDENGVLAAQLPAGGRMPVSFAVVNNGAEEAAYSLSYAFPVGHMNNPVPMLLGQNSIALEEGSQGYYFSLTVEQTGIVNITMDTEKNWSCEIANVDTGMVRSFNSTEMVKSFGIAVRAGETVRVYVNTMDEEYGINPAGTVQFTAKFIGTAHTIASGKTLTLKFVDPETGKSLAASKANWEIANIFTNNPYQYQFELAGKDMEEYYQAVDPEYYSAYGSLNNGKLKTIKNGDSVNMIVRATLKTDENVFVDYEIEVLPAATLLSVERIININMNEAGYLDGYEAMPTYYGNSMLDLNGKTADDGDYLMFVANAYPHNASMDVKWKVSGNAKIVEDKLYWDADNFISVIRVYPVWNDKTGALKNGVATITATASDGSGKKASFKVEMTSLPKKVEIVDAKGNALETVDMGYEDENGNWVENITKVMTVQPGKNYTFKANVDANASSNKKKVVWECLSGNATVKNGKVTVPKNAVNGDYIWVNVFCDENYEAYDHVLLIVESEKTAQSIEIVGQYVHPQYGFEEWMRPEEMPALDVSGANAQNVPYRDFYAYVKPYTANNLGVTWTLDKNGANIADLRTDLVGWFDDEYEWHVGTLDQVPVNAETQEYDVAEIYTVARISPKFDESKGTYKTGNVKLTATAADGITVKTVTVKIENMVSELSIVAKDGRDIYLNEWDDPCMDAVAGEKLALQAITNANAKNKKVTWYCDSPYAKISTSGVLTISKDVPSYGTTIYVEADPKDGSDIWATMVINVAPRSTNVHIRMDNGDGMKYVSNATIKHNLTPAVMPVSDEAYPSVELSALVYPFEATQNVKWTLSPKNIANLVDHGDGTVTLEFTGKTGTLTVAATANDSAKTKTSFKLKVEKGISSLELRPDIVLAANKTVKLAAAENMNMVPAKPTNKSLTWSMCMFDEYGNQVDVTKDIATLNAKTGVLKAAKNLDKVYTLHVRAVANDGYGAESWTTVTLYPAAVAKVDIFDLSGNKINGKTVTVSLKDQASFAFNAEPTNVGTALDYLKDTEFWTGMIQNGNVAAMDVFTAEDGTQYLSAKLVGAGKTKITVKATDGSNASAYFYLQVTE